VRHLEACDSASSRRDETEIRRASSSKRARNKRMSRSCRHRAQMRGRERNVDGHTPPTVREPALRSGEGRRLTRGAGRVISLRKKGLSSGHLRKAVSFSDTAALSMEPMSQDQATEAKEAECACGRIGPMSSGPDRAPRLPLPRRRCAGGVRSAVRCASSRALDIERRHPDALATRCRPSAWGLHRALRSGPSLVSAALARNAREAELDALARALVKGQGGTDVVWRAQDSTGCPSRWPTKVGVRRGGPAAR